MRGSWCWFEVAVKNERIEVESIRPDHGSVIDNDLRELVKVLQRCRTSNATSRRPARLRGPNRRRRSGATRRAARHRPQRPSGSSLVRSRGDQPRCSSEGGGKIRLDVVQILEALTVMGGFARVNPLHTRWIAGSRSILQPFDEGLQAAPTRRRGLRRGPRGRRRRRACVSVRAGPRARPGQGSSPPGTTRERTNRCRTGDARAERLPNRSCRPTVHL